MARRFGFWAALAACAASVGYGIPQLLQVAGLLPDPWDRILIFAPSLILAPLFVLAMAALHEAAPASRRVFSLSGLALATIYATLACIVYSTQLSVVIPADLHGGGEQVAFLACCQQHRFLTGVDLMGYTLMSLAMLVATPAITGTAGRAARIWFFVNGALAPFLIAQVLWPFLIYVGAAWLITFPLAMALLAAWFRRDNGPARVDA
jgi:hypothetical protein